MRKVHLLASTLTRNLTFGLLVAVTPTDISRFKMRTIRDLLVVTFLVAFIFPGVKSTGLQGRLELENFQRTHNDTLSDLIFLLDTSGSLWYYDSASRSYKIGFDDEKVFVNSLLSHIRVSLAATRVSIVLFGTSATLDINYVTDLNIKNHKCNFKKSFQALKFRSGLTNMHDAFQYAYDIIFGRLSADKRPNQLAKTAVFLLTDGMWNRGGDPSGIAKTLKDNNIEIFSIGVTNGVDDSVLRQLATDNKHAFHYSSFTQFRELATYLRGGNLYPNNTFTTVYSVFHNNHRHYRKDLLGD